MKPLAVIPARGGSKRLPRKNVLPFRGRPMIAWSVLAAVDSGVFSRVLVSTEDAEIAAAGAAVGGEVLPRPAELAADDVPLWRVMAHVLDGVGRDVEHACLLMPNCPLRDAGDVAASYRTHVDGGADSTMSVVAYDWRPPQWALRMGGRWLEPVAWEKGVPPSPLDKRERLVCPSGAIRWVRADAFRGNPSFYPARLQGHELPWHHAIDIDEADDLEMAECVAHALAHGFQFKE